MSDVPSSPGQASTRIDYIDVARGLFVTWMLIAHSLALARIPPDHWMQGLRPAGWATVCFVMLTGFGLAVVNLSRPSLPEGLGRRLYRRALQLVVIAYVSNLASEAITSAINGTLSLAYLRDVACFNVSWTISGSLIPIAITVALAPSLIYVARRIHPAYLFLSVTVLGAVASSQSTIPGPFGGGVSMATLTNASGPFGVHSGHLVLLSVCTFTLGGLTATVRASFRPWLLPTAAASALLSLGMSPGSGSATAFFRDLCIFVVSVGAVGILFSVPELVVLRHPLKLLGRAALLVFLFHRVLLHAVAAVLRPALEREALAWCLIAIALAACFGVGYAKHRFAEFRLVLARVGM
jgi:hypothetical protein